MQRLQGALLLVIGLILGVLGGLLAGQWVREQATEGTGSAQQAAAPAPSGASAGMQSRVQELFSALPAAQRLRLLEDGARFAAFVREQLASDALVAAARASGIGDDPTVRLVVERAADRALVQAWLGELERRNRPQGFPAASEVQRYYDGHRAEFSLPERAQVWQVFLAWPADADGPARKALMARAQRLAEALRKGSRRFEEVAAEVSQHLPSRYQGGYMGVVALERLLPEVRDAVRNLQPGAVSDPIVTDAGVHVVRRGALLPATTLPLDAVRARIRARLADGFREQLRARATRDALDRFGPLPDDDVMEGWRQAWRSRARGERGRQDSE